LKKWSWSWSWPDRLGLEKIGGVVLGLTTLLISYNHYSKFHTYFPYEEIFLKKRFLKVLYWVKIVEPSPLDYKALSLWY